MPDEGYTGADYVVDALETWDVEHVFGNPGTTELPLMDALSKSDDLEYVLGLHEDIAVGMAGGYASTRRYHAHHDPDVNPLGFVNLHIAPGLAHGLGNLYAAKIAGVPLVVTAGNHSTDFRHEEPILSGDLVEMTDQFTKWSDEVLDVSALPQMLRRAVRVALTPPTGPVFLGLPLDVTRDEIDERPGRLGPIPDAGAGDADQLDLAADLVAEADNPRMVVGDLVARAGAVEEATDPDAAPFEALGHPSLLAGEVADERLGLERREVRRRQFQRVPDGAGDAESPVGRIDLVGDVVGREIGHRPMDGHGDQSRVSERVRVYRTRPCRPPVRRPGHREATVRSNRTMR